MRLIKLGDGKYAPAAHVAYFATAYASGIPVRTALYLVGDEYPVYAAGAVADLIAAWMVDPDAPSMLDLTVVEPRAEVSP